MLLKTGQGRVGSGVTPQALGLFPGQMSYKVTKPGLVCLSYLSMFFIVLLFIRAHFYVLLVFVGMFFQLFWLSCHYLPSDWLERRL